MKAGWCPLRASYQFCPKVKYNKEITNILIEMYKVRRRCINIRNKEPDLASEYFNKKWNKGVTWYRMILKKSLQNQSFHNQKTFNKLPIIECETHYKQAKHYFVICHAVYKAAAENIFDWIVSVSIVCHVIKPLILFQRKDSN